MSATEFKDAEAFLAELGVERNPIIVRLPAPEEGQGSETVDAIGLVDDADEPVDVDGPVDTTGEVDQIVEEDDGLLAAVTSETPPSLDDAVAAALSTMRRITAAAPASEGRLRRKLEQRELPVAVIDAAMVRARRERLVDDEALAAALVAEWRASGHGGRRIRADMRKREFDEAIIVRAVAEVESEDPMAAAFALATERAAKMRHVPAETAFRRIADYVARRGHAEPIARKAARDAVFDDLERDRVSGH